MVWLEQTGELEFVEHVLDDRPGAIHAYPFDADADGDLDIAVALSQESEEVLLFRNDGAGEFAREVIFAAGVMYYGLSGIELADLDMDGDTDILYTNGDTLDRADHEILPNNFYGLAWLENDGTGAFTSHELTRYWGAYAVKAADLDGDSDMDLVLSGVQLPNMYPQDEVQNLIWLENDGEQNFARRIPSVALPPFMITLDVADVDQDGIPEVFAGSHNYTGPQRRSPACGIQRPDGRGQSSPMTTLRQIGQRLPLMGRVGAPSSALGKKRLVGLVLLLVLLTFLLLAQPVPQARHGPRGP